MGRVIARPYVGKKKGEFKRTSNRHDYALKPTGRTALNALKDKGLDVIGVGKINDIYRKVIYLKSEDERILMAVKNRMEKYIEINRGFQSLKIQFDMNP